MDAEQTVDMCCTSDRVRAVPTEAMARNASMLKAMGHPVRLAILHILSASGSSVCACDIEAQFTLSQPTISHHLRILREAGLVEGVQRGQWVHYSVRRPSITALAGEISALGT